MRKAPFLTGVALLTLSLLAFQILQTRILSVTTWYYMAFFGISVAMLGMTAGAVWVYLRRERLDTTPLPLTLANFTLAAAVAMPASILLQFSLVTVPALALTTVVAWSLVLAAIAVPYIFAGVAVSLALTRSHVPTGLVYGVDMLGAAAGCIGVILLLNRSDAPTAVIVCGAVAGLSAVAFARSASPEARLHLLAKPWWRRPVPVTAALAVFAALNSLAPVGIRPIVVKHSFELSSLGVYERWNSYSRIQLKPPSLVSPSLWGPSPALPPETETMQADLRIDGAAGTTMFHDGGPPASIAFLAYDLPSLAYRLPGIHKSAVVGVGGGRDLMTAHIFGVSNITGVELNPIFIDLLTKDPVYSRFANLAAIPNLNLHVDDARSWFASTPERFDLVQMSMIDTWAATGAGAFSLSENGLYTLEGWRAFLRPLNAGGIFTVSRWYSPGNVDETGRMIALATAVLLDSGVPDARPHLFVASADNIATLVLAKQPFTAEQLGILNDTTRNLGFQVLLAPGQPPASPLLREIVASPSRAALDRVVEQAPLDLTVSTDDRPFFFNQLRFRDMPRVAKSLFRGTLGSGVVRGNLIASGVLFLILGISIVAVVAAILVPLRRAAQACPRPLAVAGSLYFAAIGMGFMLAEIALLERFSVYLGHPIYSLSVSLFSLILSCGLGSLASDRLRLDAPAKLLAWAGLLVACLVALAHFLPTVFAHTTDRERPIRIAISVAALMPLGFLLGFAFPTGMRLVQAIDPRPAPWFWGINGAAGVLASVLGVMFSIALGIEVTLLLAAACYLLLIPIALSLLKMDASDNRRLPRILIPHV